jgi:hypothetical protein
MKTCSKCGEVKENIEFNRSRADCKTCNAAYAKQYREDNKEHVAASRKQYREDNKERRAAYAKQWYEDNKERRAAYDKQYHEDNKEHLATYDKQYREDNPVKCRMNNLRSTNMKGLPEKLIEVKALQNLINHTINTRDQ